MSVCRICLSTDVNMHNINNSKVQEVFEKLTNKQLPEKDRPNTMCYLCYSQLKKCTIMLNLIKKTENIFQQLSCSGTKITNHINPALKRSCVVNLVRTPDTHIDITPMNQRCKETDENLKKVIKEEPKDELVQIKIEAEESEMECDVAEELQDVIYEESDESSKDTWDAAKEKQHIKKSSKKTRIQNTKNNVKIKDNTQRQNDAITKKSLSCKICDKTFKRMHNLRKHIKIHDPKHVCSKCNKSFSLKNNLLRHKAIVHAKNRHFPCNVCHKSFTRSDHLLRHMRSHTKEKPFPCIICNMMFSTTSNVQQHVNSIHLDKRPFACDLCDKTFSRKGNLQEHYRGHTGDKPFSCDVCATRFTYLSNLKQHRSKMHSDST